MLKRFAIFLTLVVIVCGGFYLSSPERMVERVKPVWPVVDAAKVDRIDVCLLEQDCYSLVRRADGWNIARQGWKNGPVADLVRVERLLSVLAQGTALRYVGNISGKEYKQYHFDKPQVRIATGGGQELSMTVGGESPAGEGVFALSSKDQNDLFLLDKDFVNQIKYPAEYYYKLYLLTGNPDKISSISLGDGGSVSWIISRSDGEYIFTYPAELKGNEVSSSNLDLLIHSLYGLSAKELVSDGLYKLGKPVLNIEVEYSGKNIEQVEVFENAGGEDFYLANATSQNGFFIVTKEHLQQFNKKTFQMRKRNILAIETVKIGSLRVLQGNQTFSGVKSDKKTWINFEDKKPLLGIDMSLWRLNELKFEAEPVSVLSASAEKTMELELRDASGVIIVDVVFYSDPELPAGQCWLSLDNSKVYYPVSDQLLEDLQGQIPLRK